MEGQRAGCDGRLLFVKSLAAALLLDPKVPYSSPATFYVLDPDVALPCSEIRAATTFVLLLDDNTPFQSFDLLRFRLFVGVNVCDALGTSACSNPQTLTSLQILVTCVKGRNRLDDGTAVLAPASPL